MKLLRLIVVTILLVPAVGFAAFAEGITLEVGALGAALNAFSSAQQKPGAATAITSNLNLVPDPYVNGYYALKPNDSTTLRLGLRAEDMMGTISPSFVNFARAEPFVDLLYGPLTVRVSFPLYFIGTDATNDPAYAEIKYLMDYAYKGISLGTFFGSGMNTFLFTNYENIAYKLSFDKTTALVFSVSAEIGFSPAWLYDVNPQVSLIYGPWQLDVLEAVYFSDQGSTTPSFSDAGYNLRLYTYPKLTFDFTSIGVPGLKAYFRASSRSDACQCSSIAALVWISGSIALSLLQAGGAIRGSGNASRLPPRDARPRLSCGDQLLAAVDVEGRASDCGVRHEVDGEGWPSAGP